MLPHAFWGSLVDDPVAGLLLVALASLAWCWCCWGRGAGAPGGVVLVLLGLVVSGFLGVLVALPSAAWLPTTSGPSPGGHTWGPHLGLPGTIASTANQPTLPKSSAQERLSSS